MYETMSEGSSGGQSVEELLALKEKAERRKKELEEKLARQDSGADLVKAAIRARNGPTRISRKASRQKDLSLFSFIVHREAAESGSADKLDYLEKRLEELRKRRESIIQEVPEDGGSGSSDGEEHTDSYTGSEDDSESESDDASDQSSESKSNPQSDSEGEGADSVDTDDDEESTDEGSEGKGEASRDDESATDSPAEDTDSSKEILSELRAACATLPDDATSPKGKEKGHSPRSPRESAPARLSKSADDPKPPKSASRRENLKLMSNASKPFYNKDGSARGKSSSESGSPVVAPAGSSPYVGIGSGPLTSSGKFDEFKLPERIAFQGFGNNSPNTSKSKSPSSKRPISKAIGKRKESREKGINPRKGDPLSGAIIGGQASGRPRSADISSLQSDANNVPGRRATYAVVRDKSKTGDLMDDGEEPEEEVKIELPHEHKPKKNFADLEEPLVKLFAESPKKCINRMIEDGLIRNTPSDIAGFLYTCNSLDKVQKGDYLGEEVNSEVLIEYCKFFDFTYFDFDMGLRRFLFHFRLPGEAQKIDRLMNAFAKQYYEQNTETHVFKDLDAVYITAVSTMMLNTDAHNPNVKEKMSLKQFISNNRGINAGGDLPEWFVASLFDKISTDEIKMSDDVAFPTAIKKGWVRVRGTGLNFSGLDKTSHTGKVVKKLTLAKKTEGSEEWWRVWAILCYDEANDKSILYFFNSPKLSSIVGTLPLNRFDITRVRGVTEVPRLEIKDATSSHHHASVKCVKGKTETVYLLHVTPTEQWARITATNANKEGAMATECMFGVTTELERRSWANMLRRYRGDTTEFKK